MKHFYLYWKRTLAVVLCIGMAACSTDLYDPEVEPEEPTVTPEELPGDFTWSMDTETELSVNIEGIGKSPYIVEAYVGNPAIDPTAKMIAGSQQLVNNQKSYKASLSFPKGIETIYLRITDDKGRITVYGFDAVEGSMVCNIGSAPVTQKSMELRSDKAQMPAVDYSYAGKEYIELSGNGDAKLDAGAVYVIPKGKAFGGSLELPGEGQFSLYVEGIWTVKNSSLQVQKESAIYVLNGGSVKAGRKDIQISFVNNSRLAVQKGGKFGEDDDEGFIVYLTNSTSIVNEGDFEAKSVKLDSDADVYNNGDFDTGLLASSNSTNYVLNLHELEAKHIVMQNGVIDNFCKLESDKMEASGGSIEINLGPAAYVETDQLFADHLKISMDAKSLWDSKHVHFKSNNNQVIGGTTDYALFRVEKKIEVQTKAGVVVTYSGKVNIECGDHTNHPDQWNPCYKLIDPANFSEGQGFAEIDEDDCNNFNGNHNGGNEENKPGDNVTEPGNTLAYVYWFEDNWPQLGDYDMNDIVMTVSVRNTNTLEGTTAADITATLYAVGARQQLAAAIQLDGIPAGAVAGAEAGQEYAVIKLFDDAHAELGAPAGNQFNTFNFDASRVKEIHKHIEFTQPLSHGIGNNYLNVFIVHGGMDKASRYEIHLPGFTGTKKAATNAASTTLYTHAETGWMWGLRMAQTDFVSFPKEVTHVQDAYSGFKEWYRDGGTPSWYRNPVKDKVILIAPEEDPAEGK